MIGSASETVGSAGPLEIAESIRSLLRDGTTRISCRTSPLRIALGSAPKCYDRARTWNQGPQPHWRSCARPPRVGFGQRLRLMPRFDQNDESITCASENARDYLCQSSLSNGSMLGHHLSDRSFSTAPAVVAAPRSDISKVPHTVRHVRHRYSWQVDSWRVATVQSSEKLQCATIIPGLSARRQSAVGLAFCSRRVRRC